MHEIVSENSNNDFRRQIELAYLGLRDHTEKLKEELIGNTMELGGRNTFSFRYNTELIFISRCRLFDTVICLRLIV